MNAYADVPDHDGAPRREGDEFFGPPPPASIGAIISASTTLSARAVRTTTRARVGAAVVAAVIAAGVAAQTGVSLPPAWGPVMVLAAAAIGWLVESPLRVCSYIGDDGAWLVTRSRFTGRTTTRALRFADADRRTIAFTRNLGSEGYSGTRVTATWLRDRQPVFTVTGDFDEGAGANDAAMPTDVEAAFATSPAHLAAVAIALVARDDRWCAARVDDEAPLSNATMDALVAHGRVTVAAAIERLFEQGRWEELDELAGTALDAGVAVDGLRHAWALLELEDPETALAQSDHVLIRMRAAIAGGDLATAGGALPELRHDGFGMRSVVVADLLAALGDVAGATAALRDAQRAAYPLAHLATTAWPSAPVVRALLGADGPYR